jgi:hypothetical protein
VQVAESSGGFFSSLDCMMITGVAAIAEKEGVSDQSKPATGDEFKTGQV